MNSIKKVFLIRHCRPQFAENVGICLGRKDIPLSKEGIAEAEQLKRYFSNISLRGIYSSPLIRARHTAEIIADNKMNVIIRNDFSELNMGKWDGMSFAEIKEKYPLEYIERGKDFQNYTVEDGESMADCQTRAVKELYNTVQETSGDILIVAHAGVNRAIISEILGIGIKDSFAFKHEYGSVNILAFEDKTFKVLNIGISISELNKI